MVNVNVPDLQFNTQSVRWQWYLDNVLKDEVTTLRCVFTDGDREWSEYVTNMEILNKIGS